MAASNINLTLTPIFSIGRDNDMSDNDEISDDIKDEGEQSDNETSGPNWDAIWSEFGGTTTLPVKSVESGLKRGGLTLPQALAAIDKAISEGLLEHVSDGKPPPRLRRV